MKNKLVVAVVILALFVSQLGIFAFSDMDDERLSWALEAIESMTEQNIIKGYEDGTFRPDQAITKEESLILMSRISGFYEESSEEYKLLASEAYADILEDYETAYKDEISFLLYRGVMSIDDVQMFAADDVRTQSLKRYEAAILLAKLMGAEDLADEELTYDDKEEIPEEAQQYVAYVTKQELMNGMGENRFEPMVDVTRAQIATILYRAMGKLDYSYVTAELCAYNPGNDIATITVDGKQEKYVITSDVPVALDGSRATIADVRIGAKIRITFSGEKIAFIDAVTPEYEETVSLVFIKYEKLTDAVVVTFKNPITEEKIQYSLGEAPIITRNGASSSITALKANDFAVVNIVNGKIKKIDAEDAEKTIVGTVSKITLDAQLLISIDTEGEVTEFEVYDNVVVKRDNKAVELADILVGDKVTVVTKYNVISKITATSSTSKLEGKIVEIRISKSPSIIISVDGTEKEFPILNSIEVQKNGEDADIYALRLGDTAKVTLESETVIKIDVVPSEESAYVTGKVEYFNAAYGYVKLEGVEEIIFINKAKFQTASGDALTIKNVAEGKIITAFGIKKIGAYEATLVIVN